MGRLVIILLILVVTVGVLLLLTAGLLGLGWGMSRVLGFAEVTPYQATVVLMFVIGTVSYWIARLVASLFWMRGSQEAEYEEEEPLRGGILNAVPPRSSRRRSSQRPAPTSSDEPGRNDPCPCGSGKKYRRCCGRKTM